ncbi:hypothetical protein D917_04499 [Trichinella nativa]|uniref:Uncharacterized protein n=1 Tax=Trichinella nativa TaxID=6335 RepID=A0A1Y3E7V7_9BILA|nr:hypothetical protein D917_04499 [Trichinella nativa]
MISSGGKVLLVKLSRNSIITDKVADDEEVTSMMIQLLLIVNIQNSNSREWNRLKEIFSGDELANFRSRRCSRCAGGCRILLYEFAGELVKCPAEPERHAAFWTLWGNGMASKV